VIPVIADRITGAPSRSSDEDGTLISQA